MAKAGDRVPDTTLFEGDFDHTTSLAEVFKGKKGVLFAVPGAYTPGCSKTHLPGYVADYDKLKAAGAEVIACTSTDNAFVLKAWGDAHGAAGKVRMLSDPQGKLAAALGVSVDAPPLGTASKRYSAVIADGVIRSFNLEGDGFGLTCSLASEVLGQLQQA